MATSAETTNLYPWLCPLCSTIEAGRLEEVRKLIQAERDVCHCRAKQPVYKVIKFYQRFLRDCRTDSMAKAVVWKSPGVYKSSTRALVLEVCAKLLAGGAAINYTTGLETPLMAALSTCDEELLWLLLDFKADVNLCDGVEDMNALGLAILLNEVSLVEMLLKHGAKVNSLCCGNLVPIQLAMNKNSAVSNLLIQYGADVHQLRTVSLDDKLFTSQSPLHVAILRKNVHLGRLLLEHGEDVNQTFNDSLELPIHQAVRNLDLDMIELLIEYGADLNRPNFERHTPVGLSLVIEDPVATEIAKRLILAGASANQRTRISFFQKMYSPLHIACFKGNLDFVRFLVEEVCRRIGYWDEEMEAPASESARVGKKEGWAAQNSSSKGFQDRFFKLLPRNERCWATTPSAYPSVSIRQGAASSTTTPPSLTTHTAPASTLPEFEPDRRDYHVRSEVSPSCSAVKATDPPSYSGNQGECGVDRSVEDASAQPRRGSSDTCVTLHTPTTSGGICSVCRDSRNHLGASASVSSLSKTAGDIKAVEESESHNIVFILGDDMVDKSIVKEQLMAVEEGLGRCSCCDRCLSADLASLSLAAESDVVDTVHKEDLQATETGTGDSETADSSEDSVESVSAGLLPSSVSGQTAVFDVGEMDLVESPENQLIVGSVQTHDAVSTIPYAEPAFQSSQTLAQPSAQSPFYDGAYTLVATGGEVGATAGNPSTTTQEGPIFQAEFGSPDYEYPPHTDSRWRHLFVRREKQEGEGEMKCHSVARFLNQVGSDGSTALFMAVYDGNVQLVDYLLENGANPHFSSQHGNFFHAAVLSQSEPLIQRALDLHCNINEHNMFGNSPLTLVSRLDLPNICELLITNRADMNSRDRYGETPLLASVYFGCEMNARMLIQHGAALDLVDDNHTSAIYWSIFNNRVRTLKLLLMAGASFTPQVFRQYPRNIRVMNNRPLFRFIHHYVHQPRSLQDLATIRIRTHMGVVSHGRSILAHVELLPIPNRLKEVVRLKHFIEAIDAELDTTDLEED